MNSNVIVKNSSERDGHIGRYLFRMSRATGLRTNIYNFDKERYLAPITKHYKSVGYEPIIPGTKVGGVFMSLT